MGLYGDQYQLNGLLVGTPERPNYVSLDKVRSLEVTSYGRGALEGLGLGILTGAAFGALAGYAGGDDPPCMEFFCLRATAGQKAFLGGVVGGLSGGFFGLLIGSIVGHRDYFVF